MGDLRSQQATAKNPSWWRAGVATLNENAGGFATCTGRETSTRQSMTDTEQSLTRNSTHCEYRNARMWKLQVRYWKAWVRSGPIRHCATIRICCE
jgi:hypothetical protein